LILRTEHPFHLNLPLKVYSFPLLIFLPYFICPCMSSIKIYTNYCCYLFSLGVFP
jgi:hypothetical protein